METLNPREQKSEETGRETCVSVPFYESEKAKLSKSIFDPNPAWIQILDGKPVS
jgi:hypothetical protein